MKKRWLVGVVLAFPLFLLAQEDGEGGRVVVIDSALPAASLPIPAESQDGQADRFAGAEARVIVTRGEPVYDTAFAVVAQLPEMTFSRELLSDEDMALLLAVTNQFGTDGKRMPWKPALEEVLRPVKMRFYEDGRVVKIGSGEHVDALYAAQGAEQLAANHTRIELNCAGGMPISAALRTIQRLAGINMNVDYMGVEHRGLVSEQMQTADPTGTGDVADTAKTVVVQAVSSEAKTSYSTPEGQKVLWRVVLKEVLDPIGCTFVEDNGTVKPMPKALEAKFQQDKINAQPLVTRLIQVHHANAEIILEKLKQMNLLKHEKGFMDISYGKDDNAKTLTGSSGGGVQSGSGEQVGASGGGGGAAFGQLKRPRSPQGIILSDIEENLPEIEKQIKLLDIRDRQVLIEALILDVSDAMKQELGVKWGDLALSYNSQVPPNTLNNVPALPINLAEWSGKVVENRFATLPISFDAVIKMIAGDVYSRVLGSRIITVGDHGEAVLQIATITPVEQSKVSLAGDNAQTAVTETEWLSLQTGYTLWVAPEISADGQFVRLSVHPQITEIGVTIYASKKEGQTDPSDREKNYEVLSQELDTRVTVRSGTVLLLGGLTKSKQIDTVDKVPLLGDIPFLGRLFRYKVTERRQSHLVLLIRPTVLDDENPDTGYEAPSLKVAEPMLKGIGKDLDPTRGEDPIVPKEQALLEKWGLRKGEEPAQPGSVSVDPAGE